MFLYLLTCCSVGLVRTSDPAKELQYARRLDLNDGPVKIAKSEEDPNTITTNWDWDKTRINLTEPSRVKYQTFYFNFLDLIVVPGMLPNGKTYSIWLDTGYPGYALTNGLTILENDLAIYPLGKDPGTSAHTGICYLPSFQIGQVTIINPPCYYLQLQWEVRLLGLPIWQQKGVIVGLGLLKDFRYIVFNNIKKEVEFVPTGPFEPDEPEHWDSYPFEIENGQLMVDIPVDGQDLTLMFDTCGRYGMVVNRDMWEKLPASVRTTESKEIKFFSGFLGQLPCRRARIKKLKIANLTIKKSEILILPEDSPYKANYIGMKYFRDTVVVLDFERNLMWVKNSGTD